MAPLRAKFYYLAPTSEIPSDGPIRLGSIISLPRLVAEPINDSPVPPVSFAEKVYLYNTVKHNVVIDKNKHGQGGIFAEFLQNLGISGKAEGRAGNNDSEEWTFESLKTIWFTPSLEYVRKSLEDTDVQDFILENRTWLGRKKLYMVTGVKVAYMASSTIASARERGLNLHVGFDFTSLGVPITVGPDLGYQQALTVTQTQDGADPFVFAFRLRQVKVSPAGDFEHKDFNKGALLSLHVSNSDGQKDEVKIVVEGLEDFDTDGSEFMLQGLDAVDEEPLEESGCKYAKT